MTPKQIAEELMTEFMSTAPLTKEVTKDIVKKHIELLMPFLSAIDKEFNMYDDEQVFYEQVKQELENL